MHVHILQAQEGVGATYFFRLMSSACNASAALAFSAAASLVTWSAATRSSCATRSAASLACRSYSTLSAWGSDTVTSPAHAEHMGQPVVIGIPGKNMWQASENQHAPRGQILLR